MPEIRAKSELPAKTGHALFPKIPGREGAPGRETVIAGSVTDLYRTLKNHVEVRAWAVSVPPTGKTVIDNLGAYSHVALTAHWKKDAPTVMYGGGEAFVPSSYPVAPETIKKAQLLQKNRKHVSKLVREAVAADAKAAALDRFGAGRYRLGAEKLRLQADSAYARAKVEELGVLLDSRSLSYNERTSVRKARIFYSSFSDELEQQEKEGRQVSNADIDFLVQTLRRELGIGGKNEPVRTAETKPMRRGLTIVRGTPTVTQEAVEQTVAARPQATQRASSLILLSVELAGLGGGVVACSSYVPLETPPPGGTELPRVTEGAPATPSVTTEPMVGVIETPTTVPSPDVPTPTPEVGVPVAWVPPTLEQVKAGVGGSVPADVGAQMAEYEGKASGKIPSAATVESSWNQGVGDDYRLVTFARNGSGNILWSTGTLGFNEYPIYWEYDASGNIKVVDKQTFAEIPESKEAVVVFTGTQGKTGNGEKPVIVKDIVTLPDGTQVFARYFDYLTGEWKINPHLPDEIKNILETPVFVPEGFVIADGGLLRNPETGKNVLAINPEADWKRVREGIIGGLWQANVDWYKFTGEKSDALNYSSKEEFIKAALEGKTFKIGIPVRVNLGEIDKEKHAALYISRDRLVILKTVNIRLDTIQIQVLVPKGFGFGEYTGKGFHEAGQEAYGIATSTNTQSGSNAVLFSENNGQLVISVGSFYGGDQVITSRPYLIGNFDPALFEKYKSYFRPDGIGVEADSAVSWTLGLAVSALKNFPNAHYIARPSDGKAVKIISNPRALDWDFNGFWIKPHKLFIFSQ